MKAQAANNALNCRSLRSLDVQKLRFWPPVSLIVIHPIKMSELQEKLRQNKNRRERELFLTALDKDFSNFLEAAEFSHDLSSLKYAAFSTWDNEENCQTTTRGQINGWKIRDFYTLPEIVTFIRESIKSESVSGWFFISAHGPYYSMTLSDFIQYLHNLTNYCEQNNHYDIGWVGRDNDMGIVIEFNHTSFCRNQLELCTWGV